MAISETKMQMVIANYFKDECDVNTSIKQAFEKGFRIGVKKGASTNRPQGKWIDRSDGGRILHPWWESYECSQCKEQGSGAWNFCPHCGARMKGADDE